MNHLKYIFRANENGIPFHTFGITHILIFLFCITTSYILFKKIKENRKLELVIGGTLLIQQVTLYSWYLCNNYNLFQQGLPLYHCRIAILALSIGLIFKLERLLKFGAIWGLMGSFSALLLPNPDPFLFPHVTNISFVVGHLLLMWGSVYILWVKDTNITKNNIKEILIITNIYCLSMYVINIILGSNYGYMNESPIHISGILSLIPYGLLAGTVINILVVIMYLIYKSIKLKRLTLEIEERVDISAISIR